MSSLFADTHNMVAILAKSDDAEEDVIREILQLDDAEGVVCLPNEEIFAGLAQIRYEKPSTKLTFYKAFFSSQWKFLIHTLLQSLSAKRTSWNEFSSAMDSANQISDLSTHTTRYIFPALTQKVFANMRRVGKGFLGVETPLFEGMLAAREITEEGITEEQVQADDDVAAVVQETDKIAQTLEITKLKQRVKKLERRYKLKVSKLKRLKKVGTAQRVDTSEDTVMDDVSKQGEIIANMDANEDVTLKDVAAVKKDDEIEENEDVQG
nr:hypothetical protein [Tanacetum cinerariifolium]